MSNVTSTPSLSTRFSVWIKSIPLVTRAVLILCTIIILSEYIFGSATGAVCLVPAIISQGSQLYRLITPVWFHGGILHIVLNMMAFLPMGTVLERNILGSLGFAYIILLFDLICGLVHVFLAAFLYYNPVIIYPSFMMQCNIGFSSILFALLTLNVHQNPNSNRSLFGIMTVPAKLYPWILLIVLQLIMPGISFLGHLSGILAGYLYVYGLLNMLLPSPSTLNKIESSNALGWIVVRDGYITNPHLGSPSSGTLPTRSNNNQPGFFDSLRAYMTPAPTTAQPFSGSGRPLGSSPRVPPTSASGPASSGSSEPQFPGTGRSLI